MARLHRFDFDYEGTKTAIAVVSLDGLAEPDVLPIFAREVARSLGDASLQPMVETTLEHAIRRARAINKEIAH